VIGRRINNYEIKALLGEGGMGSVYLAEHPLLGRQAAVKVLRPEHALDQNMVGRFINEARASSAIHHPGIVEVFDVGTLSDGQPYLMMELLAGETLAQRLRREGSLPASEAIEVAVQAAGALSAAHAHGIVHRDLKPDNLFLVGDLHGGVAGRRVKVLDFGNRETAPPLERAADPHQHRFADGNPAVHVARAVPGISSGIDQRTDVYALGIILYEMLVGEPPFLSEGFGDVLLMHLTRPPRPPARAGAGDPRSHRGHRAARAGEGSGPALRQHGGSGARAGGRRRCGRGPHPPPLEAGRASRVVRRDPQRDARAGRGGAGGNPGDGGGGGHPRAGGGHPRAAAPERPDHGREHAAHDLLVERGADRGAPAAALRQQHRAHRPAPAGHRAVLGVGLAAAAGIGFYLKGGFDLPRPQRPGGATSEPQRPSSAAPASEPQPPSAAPASVHRAPSPSARSAPPETPPPAATIPPVPAESAPAVHQLPTPVTAPPVPSVGAPAPPIAVPTAPPADPGAKLPRSRRGRGRRTLPATSAAADAPADPPLLDAAPARAVTPAPTRMDLGPMRTPDPAPTNPAPKVPAPAPPTKPRVNTEKW
jgi:serine/threonine protein kinase